MFFNRPGKGLRKIRSFCFLVLFVSGCADVSSVQQVCYQNHCFEIEVAKTAEERTRGLQFREFLPENKGMLFVFEENRPYRFWMKDTLIPLDMIWLDEAKKAVHIEENVPPCTKDPCPTYGPSQKARYVLEVNAEKAKAAGIKQGVTLEFHL